MRRGKKITRRFTELKKAAEFADIARKSLHQQFACSGA
jgi:hypothetical protein